jgi:hypothetical protein
VLQPTLLAFRCHSSTRLLLLQLLLLAARLRGSGCSCGVSSRAMLRQAAAADAAVDDGCWWLLFAAVTGFADDDSW